MAAADCEHCSRCNCNSTLGHRPSRRTRLQFDMIRARARQADRDAGDCRQSTGHRRHPNAHKSALAGNALRVANGRSACMGSCRALRSRAMPSKKMSRRSVRRAGNHVVLPILESSVMRASRIFTLTQVSSSPAGGAPSPLPVVSASLRRHTVECRCLATMGDVWANSGLSVAALEVTGVGRGRCVVRMSRRDVDERLRTARKRGRARVRGTFLTQANTLFFTVPTR